MVTAGFRKLPSEKTWGGGGGSAHMELGYDDCMRSHYPITILLISILGDENFHIRG